MAVRTADANAATPAPDEERLILLPVDLDDASVNAVAWAARNVLRHGASVASSLDCRGAVAARFASRCLRASRRLLDGLRPRRSLTACRSDISALSDARLPPR